MTVAVGVLLTLAVAAACLGGAGLLRLATPLERLHVATFVNAVAGGGVTLAALLADGPGARTGKVLLIWIVTLLAGSLLSHTVGRAVHVRDGERR